MSTFVLRVVSTLEYFLCLERSSNCRLSVFWLNKLHNQNFGASSSGCTDQQTKIGVKLKSCWSFDRQLWIRHRAHFNYHHVVPDKYYPAAATRPESHFQSPCFTSPTQLSVPSELEERLFRAPVFQSLLKRFTFPSSDHWG